ncbi:cytidine deaminase [Robiginitalea aurantiaca]|uniref:Cytidine deaminase n=1 Tax=Robiginitalea aurantiaca TaxID=3056915 RepID=A0ABT7WHK4_9FLAO|nr:cytidine deaminase [Robiginitalea aurantiaca]MDM9632289.1 cytidine deaminase [Robiginitalea aurantiaca]
MEKRHFGFEVCVYKDEMELSAGDRALLARARDAASGAYAPYSGFRVGAALSLKSGEVIIGNNQENASYPSGLCAERVAVFQKGARFPDGVIGVLAVVAMSPGQGLKVPAAPCGNCRQSLLEYEVRQEKPIRILLQADHGLIYECPSVAALLPLGFDKTYLDA